MVEIISIIENTKKEGSPLQNEHGLSLFLTYNDKSYLIDTGASDKFIENSKALGIDLQKLGAVVVSHNHYDHIGGLEAFFTVNKGAKVYIKRAAQSKFFSKRRFYFKNISAPNFLFKKFSDRFIFIDEKLEIDKNVWLMSNIVKNEHYSCKDSRLLERKNLIFRADTFKHELFIVIEEENHVIIVSSCSHNGIVNIARSVQQEFPHKPIKNIVGGFHLKSLSREMNDVEAQKYTADIADTLDNLCSSKIYTCHCTGLPAFNAMKEKLPEKLEYLATGDKLSL
ncbi:MAG: MBL fold metallo-hydrolase [Rikenellaceae bacterium]